MSEEPPPPPLRLKPRQKPVAPAPVPALSEVEPEAPHAPLPAPQTSPPPPMPTSQPIAPDGVEALPRLRMKPRLVAEPAATVAEVADAPAIFEPVGNAAKATNTSVTPPPPPPPPPLPVGDAVVDGAAPPRLKMKPLGAPLVAAALPELPPLPILPEPVSIESMPGVSTEELPPPALIASAFNVPSAGLSPAPLFKTTPATVAPLPPPVGFKPKAAARKPAARPRIALMVVLLILLLGGGGYYGYIMWIASDNAEATPPAKPIVPLPPRVEVPEAAVPEVPAEVVAPVPLPVVIVPEVVAPAPVVPKKPSQAFRVWIEAVTISGVFQGTPPRALINGRTVRVGDMVDSTLGIIIDGIDIERRTIRFKERSGAISIKKY
jgi:hypothetical protein